MKIENKQELSLFQRVNFALDEGGAVFARWVIVPTLNVVYSGTGELIARTAGCFSQSLERATRRAWKDPFSTGCILSVTKPIEQWAKGYSRHKPTKNRLFHFIDRSVISHAQHLYLYLRNMNKLLELPGGMKEFIREASLNSVLSRSARLGGRVFVAIDSLRLQARTVVLTVLHYLIRAIDLFLQYWLLVPGLELFRYLIDVVDFAKNRIHGKFSDQALEAIEKREAQIRAEIVANVTNFTVDYVATLISRVSLKSILGLGIYFQIAKAVKYSYSVSTTPLHVASGVLGSYLYWKNVVQPYLADYYQAYKDKFNPEDSTMRQFLDRYSLGILYIPIEGAKNFFL